jgi:tetratricopeptide (TPR) repeat protein
LLYYYNGQFSESAEMQKKAIELAPDDHRAWGRLAESYRWMETGAELVGETYSTAARLAEARLELNSRDWITRGLLALYYVRIDRDTEAVAMIDTALLDSGRDPESLLCAALIWQELGDEEAALTALEEMIERDATYNIYIAEEPDFKVLRGNPRFDRLMEQ